MTPPVQLVPVDAAILSSYQRGGGTGGARAGLLPLHQLGRAGVATPDTAQALLLLHNAVTAAGGDFRVTELHRDVMVQQAARARYATWVAAGKPAVGSANWNSATMKAAFVALPGRSNHNGGRAIDVHLGVLRFRGVPVDQQLDTLWAVCRTPLGWTPVIRTADEGASEAWHLDWWGDLTGTLARLGYEQAAFAGALLVGHAGAGTSYASVTQALLQRAGHSIGTIDGQAGARTRAALSAALGIGSTQAATVLARQDCAIWPVLLALPAG